MLTTLAYEHIVSKIKRSERLWIRQRLSYRNADNQPWWNIKEKYDSFPKKRHQKFYFQPSPYHRRPYEGVRMRP